MYNILHPILVIDPRNTNMNKLISFIFKGHSLLDSVLIYKK